MSPPKHLWSGDWQAELEAARAASAESSGAAGAVVPGGFVGDDGAEPGPAEPPPRPVEPPRAHPPTPAQPRPRAQDPSPAAATAATAPHERAPRDPVHRRRLMLLAALGVAGIVAAVLGGILLAHSLVDHSAPKPLPAVADKPLSPKQGQTRAGAIYARDSSAVVSIRTSVGTGTGFLIGKGTLVTNDHVVESSQTVQVRFGTSGNTITGHVSGTDPSSDLAVVKIDAAAVPPSAKALQFADSSQVQVGDSVLAIGNPFGYDRTATEGIVSYLGRTIQAPNGFSIDKVIQTDAAINPGNSGGPLLDSGGKVIGVNSQIATSGSSAANVGIGFAIPSNIVRQTVPQLERGETVPHAWLGVSTADPTRSPTQALVTTIIPGGPAEKAGIQIGDVITNIAGHHIANGDDVSGIVNAKHAGDQVSVTVDRGGQSLSLSVTLGKRPASVPANSVP